jgi:general secretion pathway protein E
MIPGRHVGGHRGPGRRSDALVAGGSSGQAEGAMPAPCFEEEYPVRGVAVRTEAPVDAVKCVSAVLARAFEQGASDIHFEPTEHGLLVRFRLDGVLHDMETVPRSLAENVIARLKVMAGLLTYRADIPQEGALSLDGAWADPQAGTPDIRVATFPTIRGERAVVRIFRASQEVRELGDLGLPPDVVATLQQAAERPDGMILMTGPAGAGKSTTLYAVTRHILRATPGRSVVALEDPVEQRVDGVTQIQIAPHGELDYPRAMRSLLRQDPQVLLIGEVRDAATAAVVIEAALTGHLLLTTMHSGDTAEALVRLLEMGVPGYQVVSTVSVVCSQRLLRTLCPACGRGSDRGGCETCKGSGYHGRTAIAEMLTMTERLREAILAAPSVSGIREIGAAQGENLIEAASGLVSAGRTDADEVRRVLGHEPK